MPAMQQQGERAGMGKLGLAAEPAVHRIEHPRHLRDRFVQRRAGDLAGSGLVEVLVEHPADGLRLDLNLFSPFPIGVEDAGQDAPKTGPSILPIGWEVGAAEKDLASRRQERGEWPPSLLGEHLDRALVAGIHVGALVPVHLDADEVLVEKGGELRILV